jgi:hypothetical protein
MVLRKHITVEEYDDGFQFSVTDGWFEPNWCRNPDDVVLDVIPSYANCENGLCGYSTYHFPPVWEDYVEHEKKYSVPFSVSLVMMQELDEAATQKKKEREFLDIIRKYRRMRDDEAQIS